MLSSRLFSFKFKFTEQDSKKIVGVTPEGHSKEHNVIIREELLLIDYIGG